MVLVSKCGVPTCIVGHNSTIQDIHLQSLRTYYHVTILVLSTKTLQEMFRIPYT